MDVIFLFETCAFLVLRFHPPPRIWMLLDLVFD